MSASMPSKKPLPDVPLLATTEVEVLEEVTTGTGLDAPWRVILFNDNVHTFDEVIFQLMKATGCSKSRAEAHAWEVHTKGKSRVYEGDMEACFRVKSILDEIALITEIQG